MHPRTSSCNFSSGHVSLTHQVHLFAFLKHPLRGTLYWRVVFLLPGVSLGNSRNYPTWASNGSVKTSILTPRENVEEPCPVLYNKYQESTALLFHPTKIGVKIHFILFLVLYLCVQWLEVKKHRDSRECIGNSSGSGPKIRFLQFQVQYWTLLLNVLYWI